MITFSATIFDIHARLSEKCLKGRTVFKSRRMGDGQKIMGNRYLGYGEIIAKRKGGRHAIVTIASLDRPTELCWYPSA